MIMVIMICSRTASSKTAKARYKQQNPTKAAKAYYQLAKSSLGWASPSQHPNLAS